MTIAYFTIPKMATDVTDSRWYNAPGGRVVFLRPDQHGETRAVLMLQHEARSAEQRSTEEAKAWLKSAFQNAGWETPRVLAGLEQADNLYFEVLRQVKLDRWFSGRVALTGDAAWCTTPISGIGTTLAVVGAYVLAGELTTTENYAQAFDRYERIMRPFVEEGQSVSKLNEKWTHPQSKFGIAIKTVIDDAVTNITTGEHSCLAIKAAFEVATDDERIKAILRDDGDTIYRFFCSLLTSAMKKGEIRKEDPELLTDYLLSAYTGWHESFILNREPRKIQRMAQYVLRKLCTSSHFLLLTQ